MDVATIAEHEPQTFQTFLPETYIAHELTNDHEIRRRAGQFIGQVTTGQAVSVETLPAEKPIETLHEAIQRASEGDEVARQMVETNVRTDVVERTLKSGHVMHKVPIRVTDEGKLVQHGQIMDSIQANSLRFASENLTMRARTEAETRNAFRIEQYYQEGWFENYSLLVISRAENLPEYGFFTETMSCSLQLTSKADDGLALESAFVAGIAAEGQAPNDEATVIKLGAELGADYAGKSPAQIIDIPILIRNDLIPNGVIDVVKMWDKINGTFFGENRSPEDYLDYLEWCHDRETLFAPNVQKITNELIVAASDLHTPLQAVRLLNDLSGLHMVDQAIMDSTINSRVFGHEAAGYIDAARDAYLRGDLEAMEQMKQKAQLTEQSSSCPSGLSDLNPEQAGLTSSDDETGDCEFTSKECPLCHKKDVKTKVQHLKSSGKKRISGSCGCEKVE